ncbi:MAG: glycosyltransferase family 39 protein [Candidatus Eremiobacteraeota bacterium]|nr:glycosyltransferase family 39 protein [Candidatus Eremiobacteraeota bacterium]MBC5827407.1 glycosyltransferase family 39 protein [Candidatus Eremiobacteraeota bacterium]
MGTGLAVSDVPAPAKLDVLARADRTARSPGASLGWLGLALLLGAFVRFWHITDHSLFLDEAFTLRIAALPIHRMLHEIAYGDFHPPTFYLATHYLIRLLHWQSWDYRYLSAPFGLLTILATWAMGRRISGPRAAAIAALVVALEPALVEWDRLYRMYSVLVALVAVSWWLLLIACDGRTKNRALAWAAYGCAALALPSVQYLGAVALLCQFGYALMAARSRWPVFICCAGALGALSPWFWAVKIQFPNGGYVAKAGPIFFAWWQVAPSTLAEAAPVRWVLSPEFAPVFTVVVVAVLIAAMWIARRTILPFWLLAVVVQIAASLLTGKTLAIPRYLYPVVPAFGLAVGILTAKFMDKKSIAAAFALPAAVLALCLICLQNTLLDPYYQFSDWYAINGVVLAHERKSDVMIFDQGFPSLVVGDYTAFRHHRMAGPSSAPQVAGALAWLDRYGHRRVWYIENQWFYADPSKRIMAHLNATRPTVGIWSESRASVADLVNVILYGPMRRPWGRRRVVKRSSTVGTASYRPLRLHSLARTATIGSWGETGPGPSPRYAGDR